MTAARAAVRALLRSRNAPLLTHASLVGLTAGLLALLLAAPFWLAFAPGVIISHRVGVLLHEYIHGIPFRRYRHNLLVLSAWDGMLLLFGLMELFRGTHLAHHRWLNTERDPAWQTAREARPKRGTLGRLSALEAVQHLKYFCESFRGTHPYVEQRRIAAGAAQSVLWIVFWVTIGAPAMVLKLLALTVSTTLMPVSFRGAVEHHSRPDDPAFANEYRVTIPLFNLNRHIHHHEEPTRPWYLLEFRTAKPLGTRQYFTHWYHVYVKKDYALMRPMRRDGASRVEHQRAVAGAAGDRA